MVIRTYRRKLCNSKVTWCFHKAKPVLFRDPNIEETELKSAAASCFLPLTLRLFSTNLFNVRWSR